MEKSLKVAKGGVLTLSPLHLPEMEYQKLLNISSKIHSLTYGFITMLYDDGLMLYVNKENASTSQWTKSQFPILYSFIVNKYIPKFNFILLGSETETCSKFKIYKHHSNES